MRLLNGELAKLKEIAEEVGEEGDYLIGEIEELIGCELDSNF